MGRGDGDGIENGTFLLSLETRNSLLTAFRLALLFLPPRYFMEASLPPSALIPSLLLQRLKLGVGGEDRRGNWAAEERGDFEHLCPSVRPSGETGASERTAFPGCRSSIRRQTCTHVLQTKKALLSLSSSLSSFQRLCSSLFQSLFGGEIDSQASSSSSSPSVMVNLSTFQCFSHARMLLSSSFLLPPADAAAARIRGYTFFWP